MDKTNSETTIQKDLLDTLDNVTVEGAESTSQKSQADLTSSLDNETIFSTEAKNENEYDPNNIHYENELAIYTDPVSKFQYEWSINKNEWIPKENINYGFEDDTHTYTDKDGVKFFWDKEKSAWFPKIDDDFMALYQMNYGFVDNTNISSVKSGGDQDICTTANVDVTKIVKGEKRKASDPTWFEVDDLKNTKVYVSNLPTDISEEEFGDLMQKCGLVMKDPETMKYKIKLYKEPGTGQIKGDGLCTYIRRESVDLSLKLLDGHIYNGKQIKVEEAKFEMKGAFDPKLKPKMKKRKEKIKIKKLQEKLLDWRPEKMIGERSKNEKIVIIKNLFDPSIFDKDVGLILEFQQDLREECQKLGDVKRVVLYDRHPEGVAQINMSSPEEADEVVKLLNGRYFMKRQLTAEIWDGKTKFKIAETESQISQRLDKWDEFLEEDNMKGENHKEKNDEKMSQSELK